MKSIFKRGFLVLLCAVMILNLVACSKSSANGSLAAEEGSELAAEFELLAEAYSQEGTTIALDKVYTTGNSNAFELLSIKESRRIFPQFGILYALTIISPVVITPGYMDAGPDNDYINLKLKYHNESDAKQLITDIFSGGFVKIDQDYYSVSLIRESKLGFTLDSELAGDTVKSGRSATLHIISDVPQDVLENSQSIELYFIIDGSAYMYTYK